MNQRERVKERDLKRERKMEGRKKDKEERRRKREKRKKKRMKEKEREMLKRKKSTKLIYLFRAGQNFVLNRVFTTDAFRAYARAHFCVKSTRTPRLETWRKLLSDNIDFALSWRILNYRILRNIFTC